MWFYNLCKDVWEHEESFVPEQKRRPWPHTHPSEAGRFMPYLGEGAAPSAGQEVEEHPIDAIIETRSPRMTDEEVEALYLKRAEDPVQVEIARVMLAREYRKDTRFADMQEVNGLIKEHLTPVETLRFEHRRMWEDPAVGIETLVERMSKAGQFKPTTLADMAPNRLGISDMDASGHGVSKIATALRIEEEAAAARNLGTDGQTALGEAGISLTPPEPAGEETRARLIETLKRIDDGVYDCLADQADAILAALSPEAPAEGAREYDLLIETLEPFAKAALQVPANWKPNAVLSGQPLAGIGSLGTAADYRRALWVFNELRARSSAPEAPVSHSFEASHSVHREGGCKVCGHDEASHEAPASDDVCEAAK